MAAVFLGLLAIPVWAQPPERPRVVALDQAIQLALGNNRELEDARLSLEIARDQVTEAWSAVYPSVDLNLSYTRNISVPGTFLPRIFVDPDAEGDELVAVKFGADNQWNLALRAEQPLFDPAAFLAAGASRQYRNLSSETVRGREIAIIARVKMAYYDVLLAEESIRLNENALRRVTQTLEETRKMQRAGLASLYEVLRLEVEQANLQPGVRRAENMARAARRTLAIELGLDAAESVDVTGSLAGLDLGEAAETPGEIGAVPAEAAGLVLSAAPAGLDLQEAEALARGNRSDLRQLELTASLRRTELRAEQVQYLPTLTLFGQYSINAQQNGSPVFFGESDAQRAYGRQVGVEFSLPLFEGFRRPARVGQLRAQLNQVITQRELLVQQVTHGVRTAMEQEEESRARYGAQRLALDQARRGYEIARAQYREGISSQLEVTDAEVALRQSEFNYAEAVYDYLVARARLDEVLGLTPGQDIRSGTTPGGDSG